MNTNEIQKLLVKLDGVKKTMTVSIELITPDTARNFLQKNLSNDNVRNRTISKTAVNAYVKDILNGRWKVSMPIIFDSENVMIDGQTRCSAIIKANKPIISLVVRGADPNIFDVIDSGKKRTHKDALTSLCVNGKVLNKPAGVSSGINLQMSINRNHKNIDKNRGILTNSEIVEIVRNDFDYYNMPFEKGHINSWRKTINNAIPENVLSGFYYNMKKNHDDINDFLTTITSNERNTPPVVREFRDMVVENKGRKSDERGYLSPKTIYLLVDALFKYGQTDNGLNNRKHFAKKDLEEIYEQS